MSAAWSGNLERNFPSWIVGESDPPGRRILARLRPVLGFVVQTAVCLITSNIEHAAVPGNVAAKRGDTGLPRPSVVNVSQVLTVDKTELENKVGRLPAAVLASVLSGLRLLLEGN